MKTIVSKTLFFGTLIVYGPVYAGDCINALMNDLPRRITHDFGFIASNIDPAAVFFSKNLSTHEQGRDILAGYFMNAPYDSFEFTTKALLEHTGFHSQHSDDTWRYKPGLVAKSNPDAPFGKQLQLRVDKAFDVGSEVVYRKALAELPAETIADIRATGALEDCPCFLETRRFYYSASPHPTSNKVYNNIDLTYLVGQAEVLDRKSGKSQRKNFMKITGIGTDHLLGTNLGQRYFDLEVRGLAALESHYKVKHMKSNVSNAVEDTHSQDVLKTLRRKDGEVAQSVSRNPLAPKDSAIIHEAILKITKDLFNRNLEETRHLQDEIDAVRKKSANFDEISYEVVALSQRVIIGPSPELESLAESHTQIKMGSPGTAVANNLVRVYGKKNDGSKELIATLDFNSEVGIYYDSQGKVRPKQIERHLLFNISI